VLSFDNLFAACKFPVWPNVWWNVWSSSHTGMLSMTRCLTPRFSENSTRHYSVPYRLLGSHPHQPLAHLHQRLPLVALALGYVVLNPVLRDHLSFWPFASCAECLVYILQAAPTSFGFGASPAFGQSAVSCIANTGYNCLPTYMR